MEAGKKTKHDGGVSVTLPEDIIFDVLTWLPVKSLCRFRCVSKSWRAVIADPAFAAAQRSRAAPLLAAVFRSRDQLELRVMDTDGAVHRAVGGVEGTLVPARLDLVCVDGGPELAGARVIDPATERAVTVSGGGDRGGFPCHRFGRAASGAYKVLRCGGNDSPRGRHGRRLEITTLGAAGEPTWRRLPPGPPAFTCTCHGCTVAVNGALHFLTGHPFAPTCRSHVACLDLESEQWKTTIQAPATDWPDDDERWETTIGELKGTLSMVETIWSRKNGAYTNVWLLVGPERSVWVKAYTIRMPWTVSLVEPLEVLRDGTILLLSTFEIEGKQEMFERKKMQVLQMYDPSTRVCKNLMKMAEHQFCGKIALYTGSLLAPSTTMDNFC